MPTNASEPGPEADDLAALLREVAHRVQEATRSTPTAAGSAELRRRLVAATSTARHDAALARRRLLALAADLDRSRPREDTD